MSRMSVSMGVLPTKRTKKSCSMTDDETVRSEGSRRSSLPKRLGWLGYWLRTYSSRAHCDFSCRLSMCAASERPQASARPQGNTSGATRLASRCLGAAALAAPPPPGPPAAIRQEQPRPQTPPPAPAPSLCVASSTLQKKSWKPRKGSREGRRSHLAPASSNRAPAWPRRGSDGAAPDEACLALPSESCSPL